MRRFASTTLFALSRDNSLSLSLSRAIEPPSILHGNESRVKLYGEPRGRCGTRRNVSTGEMQQARKLVLVGVAIVELSAAETT